MATTKLYNATDLYDDRRVKFWCGPGAVAIVTGWPLSAIRRHLWRNKTGWIDGLEPALRAAGWAVRSSRNDVYDGRPQQQFVPASAVRATDFPTLAQWSRRRERRDEVNVVLVGGRGTLHWIVVAGNRAADVSSAGAQPLSKFGLRRSRVRKVYAVERVRHVPRPAPRQKRGAGPRRPVAPYRVGYVDSNDGFVPVGDGSWRSKHAADHDTHFAGQLCERHGLQRPDWEGKPVEPVVVQRRRDGRFVRAFVFGLVCDGLARMDELDWQATPVDAVQSECRI